MTFEEKRLRAYEAGTISGNTAYMFSTKEEYVWGETEGNNLTIEESNSLMDSLNVFMGAKEYIRERKVGIQTMLDFFTRREAGEILNRYEAEINEIAAANGL